MDIVMIRDAISELEQSDTTLENVQELACLYIVNEHLSNTSKSVVTEFDDILPYYNKYIDIKKRYQLNQTTESEVIQGIKDVCREICEFIQQLYCNTDMNKERICIKKMLTDLNLEYCEK